MTKPGAELQAILREFASRFTDTLRDWFQSLGGYRQLQFIKADTTVGILGLIYQEFIGDYNLIDKQMRQEYFEMKCCSLKKKKILNFIIKECLSDFTC